MNTRKANDDDRMTKVLRVYDLYRRFVQWRAVYPSKRPPLQQFVSEHRAAIDNYEERNADRPVQT
jgi:hypothetical protein